MTADRSNSSRICSSDSCRSPGTRGPAVVMTGDHRAGKVVQGAVEALLRQVGNVQGHANLSQLGQQFPASSGEGTLDTGARRILAVAEVGERNTAQAGLPPGFQLIGSQNGICALHGDDDPHGQVRTLFRLPTLPQSVQVLHTAYQAYFTHLLQHPVVGQLALGVGIGHALGGGSPDRGG